MNVGAVSTSCSLSTALGGVTAQMDRLGQASRNIAAGEGDVVENVLDLKGAQLGIAANLAVVKSVLDTEKSVIDILV